MDKKIKIIDLFAGAGGFSLGVHMASDMFETVRAVEIDSAASATYAENFGHKTVYTGDIADWLKDEADGFKNTIDLIIGGPPCQGFSRLGKQDVNDLRNKLWNSYSEAINKIQPKIFILENVSNFYNSIEFELLKEEFSAGKNLENYSYKYYTVNSADYGSPQKRIRAVVIGFQKNIPDIDVNLVSPKLQKTEYRTVREAFEGIPDTPDSAAVLNRNSNMLPGPFELRETHWAREYREISLKRFEKIPPGGNRFDLPESLLAPCWVKHKSGSGDVMGRLRWDEPSVTIRTEFYKPEKGRYLHPELSRAITHFEAGRIQGFPDDYKFVGSKSAIARQIGNAVPIQLGKSLAESVLPILEKYNYE